MKKIIAIIFIIIITITIAWISFTKNENKEIVTKKTEMGPDPSNATFVFEDQIITLSSGRGETISNEDSLFVEEITLLDKFAYGDLNDDNKEDTALLLARYGAGSGTFIYLATFVSGPITHRGLNALFIGDRISPTNLSIENGIITFEYLDRAPNEPLSTEPSLSVIKQFIHQNGALNEI